MLRFVALAWLVLEAIWVVFQSVMQWPDPESQLWLMDLGIVYLVARLLPRATLGRVALVGFGMLVWVPNLYATASTNHQCGTHGHAVSQQAVVLVAVKLVLITAAALRRLYGLLTDE